MFLNPRQPDLPPASVSGSPAPTPSPDVAASVTSRLRYTRPGPEAAHQRGGHPLSPGASTRGRFPCPPNRARVLSTKITTSHASGPKRAPPWSRGCAPPRRAPATPGASTRGRFPYPPNRARAMSTEITTSHASDRKLKFPFGGSPPLG